MTRSELIARMVTKQRYIPQRDVSLSINKIIEFIVESVSSGHRFEIRGFGTFSLHYQLPKKGRNPRTGETVDLVERYTIHFKPGKELREQVNRNKPSVSNVSTNY